MAASEQDKPSTSNKSRIDRELLIRGYMRLGVIDEGSFAKVWRGTLAYNQTLQLAIKVINKKTADSELVSDFLPRELESLRKVRHPNFVKVYDIFEAASCVFIVMELANDSLANVLATHGAMSDSFARRVFRQICSVVKYLHNRNICHRDLKCENVLLDSLGNVKLTDLGFSRQCRRFNGRPLLSGTFCGSPAYSSPEVLQGHPYDPKLSDIWSLGCILFMLVTGFLPFDDSNPNIMVRQQLARDYRKVPKSIVRHLDPDLVRLILKILEPNPENRIALVEILSHPWMTKTNSNCSECSLETIIDAEEEAKDADTAVTIDGDVAL